MGKDVFKPVTVECHSGYKANEWPVAFIFQGERREISEILDRFFLEGWGRVVSASAVLILYSRKP